MCGTSSAQNLDQMTPPFEGGSGVPSMTARLPSLRADSRASRKRIRFASPVILRSSAKGTREWEETCAILAK